MLSQTDAPPPPIPPSDARIANCIALRDRQILIKFDAESQNPPKQCSHEQEAEWKGNVLTAFNKIPGAAAYGNVIRNIQVTARGHLLIELTTADAATFLCNPANETTFLNEFAPDTSIRKRMYTVILCFVPIEFVPHDEEALRKIKQETGMKTGGIISTSWIKNPAHRSVQQKVANIKIACTTPQAVNHLLIPTIHIEGHLIVAKKDIPEPSVCNKCQQYRHFTANCKSDHDTCTCCAGPHHSNGCPDKSILKCSRAAQKNTELMTHSALSTSNEPWQWKSAPPGSSNHSTPQQTDGHGMTKPQFPGFPSADLLFSPSRQMDAHPHTSHADPHLPYPEAEGPNEEQTPNTSPAAKPALPPMPPPMQ
jgi:hypothetical protein